MPLFGGQRRTGERRRSSSSSLVDHGGGGKATTPTLPPPPVEPRAPPQSMIPSRYELVFHCQLAHGSPTKEIKDFSNVKELYARMAEVHGITSADVS